jgi:hypothetical protein
MAKARGKGRSWFGWALGVLAALTLVIGTPEHTLDLDEAAGPAAELAVHGPVRTLLDHGQRGHVCADHCAAHVMAQATAAAVLSPPRVRPLIFAAAEDGDGHARPPSQPDRPPKA